MYNNVSKWTVEDVIDYASRILFYYYVCRLLLVLECVAFESSSIIVGVVDSLSCIDPITSNECVEKDSLVNASAEHYILLIVIPDPMLVVVDILTSSGHTIIIMIATH